MKERLKILLLDDNPHYESMLKCELNEFYELTLHSINSEKEFRKGLQIFKPEIIIADEVSSSINPIHAKEISKQLLPQTSFIIVADLYKEENIANYLKKGIDDYIPKEKINRLLPAAKSAAEKKSIVEKRDKAETKLRDSEEEYRLIMENSIDAILQTSPDGSIFMANPAACRMFGMTKEELCSSKRNDLVDINDPRLKIILEEREKTGKAKGIITFIRKDKSKFIGEVSGSLYTRRNGEVRNSMIIRDLSEQEKVEQTLKESEEHFRIAIENFPVIVFNQDKELRYTWIYHPNSSFNVENIIGKTDFELLPADDAKKLTDIKNKVLKSGIVAREKVKTTIKGKDFYYDLTVEPVKNINGDITGIACASVDITEQVSIEKALRESESFIRSVMDNLPIGIAVNTVDPSVNFQYMNDNFAKIYGTKKSVLVNEDTFWEAVCEDPVFREEIKNRVLKDCADGNPALMHWEDIPIVRKGKKTRYVSAMNVPLTEKKLMVSLVWDVTDRKRAEDALIYEQYLLHILMDFSPDSIYFKDSKSRFIRINKTQANLFNLKDPKDAIGKTDFDFFLEEHAKKAFADEQKIIKTGKPLINKEEKETWHNGSITWVSTSKVPLQDKYGKIVGTFGISRDITERKQSEERLKLLNRAIEQSPVAIVVTDKDAKIQYANSSFASISGYSIDEAIGKKPSILKSGYHSKEFYKKLWDTILSGKEWKGEFYNKRKNEELYWEEAIISPIVNDEGEITNFVEAKQDISEKKKMLEDLVEAKEKAEKSDTLKSEFLAQMSHEIRSPLNVVLNFSDMLKSELGDKAQTEFSDLFDGIESAGKRLMRTIDLIINVSEMHVGTYLPTFNKFELIDEIIERVKNEYIKLIEQKGLKFEFNSDIKEFYVYGDQYSIYQIFSNLLDNAVKYTKSGAVSIMIRGSELHGIVTVEIEDTGIGMTEEFMKVMFEPFVQEDHGYSRNFEGNGLGLALVKKYCDLNKIEIIVSSTKNIGTKFSLRFNTIKKM